MQAPAPPPKIPCSRGTAAKMHTSFCARQTAAALNSLPCTLCGIATSLIHARSASTTCTKAGAKCCRAAGLLHVPASLQRFPAVIPVTMQPMLTIHATLLVHCMHCSSQRQERAALKCIVHTNTICIRIVHTKTYASKTHGTKWDSATTTCTHAVAKKPAQHPHRTETIQVTRRVKLHFKLTTCLTYRLAW
jgi:hypothetical protein